MEQRVKRAAHAANHMCDRHHRHDCSLQIGVVDKNVDAIKSCDHLRGRMRDARLVGDIASTKRDRRGRRASIEKQGTTP
jgi:hypothetical protein